MIKIIVFGASGFLGSHLCRHLLNKKFQVTTVGRATNQKHSLDPTDSHAILNLFSQVKPDWVINLAAATNVDECEVNIPLAVNANAMIPAAISKAMKNYGPTLRCLHISTDQVYSGCGAHLEDEVQPINVYGLSKLAGELFYDSALTCILRTNFFGKSLNGCNKSFSDLIITSLKQRNKVSFFRDVKFNALHVDTLCEFILVALEKKLVGVFNLGCRYGISKADFALALASELHLPLDNASIGLISETSLRARRPLDMTMSVSKLETTLKIVGPNIEDEISKTVKEYLRA